MIQNSWLAWLLGALAFVFTLGIVVFFHGRGASYLSNNPAACANCHVMTDTYQSWRKSNHHHVATCNDCHVPSNPILKWVVKGINGMHHSYAFTFQKTPTVLKAGALSAAVSASQCRHCHASFLNSTSHNFLGVHSLSSRNCQDCHKDVGHEHK